MSETIRFVDMMDKLFDVFNVNSYDAGKKKRKPFQDPYRSADDDRVKVYYNTIASMQLFSFTLYVFTLVVNRYTSSLF